MSKTVLLIIDLQNDYFDGGKFVLPNIQKVAEQSKNILNTARMQGIPVIHIKHEFPNADAPFFKAGSEGTQINDIVKPLSNEIVIVKNHVNAFKETSLKATLDALGCQNIVIIGAMSQMCIDAAARAGSDLGYKITLIEDAIAAQTIQHKEQTIDASIVHAAYMNALGFAYAKIIDTQTFVAQLENSKIS